MLLLEFEVSEVVLLLKQGVLPYESLCFFSLDDSSYNIVNSSLDTWFAISIVLVSLLYYFSLLAIISLLYLKLDLIYDLNSLLGLF